MVSVLANCFRNGEIEIDSCGHNTGPQEQMDHQPTTHHHHNQHHHQSAGEIRYFPALLESTGGDLLLRCVEELESGVLGSVVFFSAAE